MIVSPNKIIGSLVYRTRTALNKDERFKSALKDYAYSGNCLVDDKFLLWHYPGTGSEISRVLLKIGENPNGALLKFPAILNFQSIKQEKKEGKNLIYYNLAIVGSVAGEWTTEQREVQVFDKLLRPIYEEFMKQVKGCEYFQLNFGTPTHTYYEVFTTGDNSSELMNRYGDCIDAIELHNVILSLKPVLCERHLSVMENENNLVTEDINQLLNL